jgi:saccharopine dehydrogenase (NAD+, L-lysine-forming)
VKIGLIREWKQPADKRVALSPQQCKQLLNQYSELQIIVEPSPDRCFTENEYKEAGADISDDLSQCDVLLGIKEVPIDKLIEDKTYLFFSHTIKAQPYNRKLLQTILQKDITLIDYETLEWPKGGRILGFGKWAGIVGTYNALLTWGKKKGTFELPPAYKTDGYEACIDNLKSIKLGKPKILFTGNGRVADGIREVLETLQILEVTPQELISNNYQQPVFCQMTNQNLYHRKDGGAWDEQHFYNNHKDYCCEFGVFTMYTDILINGMYWEDDMPALFTKEETAKESFNIKVIADITCDVEGSVPITTRATDIYDPTIGWSKTMQKEVPPFGEDTIDVMAVTNLPTELPKNASEAFGSHLVDHIVPLLMNGDKEAILQNATITQEGDLTKRYAYLEDFVKGE